MGRLKTSLVRSLELKMLPSTRFSSLMLKVVLLAESSPPESTWRRAKDA